MSPRPNRASTDPDPDAGFDEQADALLDRIAPILAGQSVELQGAVIAELAAIWLAGHRDIRGRAEGERYREDLLRLHADHVRELACIYLEDIDG